LRDTEDSVNETFGQLADIRPWPLSVSPKAFQGILWLKIPHSHVVNDDVEVGFGNKIPLWPFGFLYGRCKY